MTSITITDVQQRDDYEFNGKTFTPYLVSWEANGATQSAQLSQMPSTPAPKIGETLEVEVIGEGQKRRLKKIKGGANGAVGKSPQERAEIRRMWALSQAIALITAEVHAGLKFENEKPAALVTPRADWLEAQVKAAGEAS